VDPKPRGRIKDKVLLSRLHRRWRECALCGATSPLSLHHIHRHPRNDVEANLVMLCGSGTTGCHGIITTEDPRARQALGHYLVTARPDSVEYLIDLLGRDAALDWLNRRLLVD
jgi:5-methylcytosine-specific restriction endonuclease McrA